MEAYIVEWLNLLVRWTHIITGIAWIGSSFYFMWLDFHLETPVGDAKKGVTGELWSVHGGGFYHVQKYTGAPEKIPRTLHRFKWESYSTFITGFFLLGLIYYYGAELYLIDPSVMALEPWQAILAGLGFLVFGWIGYTTMCRSRIAKNSVVLAIVGFVLIGGLTWLATQIFSGRGAFIHIGAMLGSIMAANVFMVIIPNQEKVIAAVLRNEPPDPELGRQGKIRSTHNNYMTLPVLFIMISSHYPATYSSANNWLIAIILFVVGGLIRHSFNLKNKGQSPVWPLPIVAACLIGLFFYMMPAGVSTSTDKTDASSYAEISDILNRRCTTCHADKPTFPGMPGAPKAIVLTDADTVKRLAPLILQQTSTGIMPPGNLTEMTDIERATLIEWINSGSHIDD